MSTPGKWIVSDNEENFSDREEFDTEAEAIEYALNDYASEYGLQPGDRVFVGQVSHEETSAEGLAAHAFDSDRALDDISERLYDLLGEEVYDRCGEIKTTPEQRAELEAAIAPVIAAWLRKHDLIPKCFTLGRVRDYVVERDFDAEAESAQNAADANRATWDLVPADVCMGCSTDRVDGACPDVSCDWGKTCEP